MMHLVQHMSVGERYKLLHMLLMEIDDEYQMHRNKNPFIHFGKINVIDYKIKKMYTETN